MLKVDKEKREVYILNVKIRKESASVVMKTFEKIYSNQYSDVDINKRLFISSIINYFQDLFVQVSLSEETGKGIEYMNEKNLTWVVYRWQIKVNKYPNCKDDVIVKMMPTAYNKSYMNIKFAMYDKKGERIAEAFSLWILLDVKDNRPCNNEVEDSNIRKTFALREDENKVDRMKHVDVLRKVETIDNMYNEKKFKVGYSDIDTNRHANNSRYISWIIEPLSKYLMNGYSINEMRISYRKSAMYGEIIKACCNVQEDKQIKAIDIITDDNDSILAAAEVLIVK